MSINQNSLGAAVEQGLNKSSRMAAFGQKLFAHGIQEAETLGGVKSLTASTSTKVWTRHFWAVSMERRRSVGDLANYRQTQ